MQVEYTLWCQLSSAASIARLKATGENVRYLTVKVKFGAPEFARCVDLFSPNSRGHDASGEWEPETATPAALLDRIEADTKIRAAGRLRETLEALCERKTTTMRCVIDDYAEDICVAEGFDTLHPKWPYDSDAATKQSPEAVAWLAELRETNAQRKLEAEVRLHARVKAEMEKQAAAAHKLIEEAETRKSAITRWIPEFGSQGQRDRLAEGFLGDEEALASIRDHVFAPLADWPRYDRITKREVCTCDYGDDCELTCNAGKATTLTDEQFAKVAEARRLMLGSDVLPRLHEGETSDCEEVCTRYGLMVRVHYNGLYLSREFSL